MSFCLRAELDFELSVERLRTMFTVTCLWNLVSSLASCVFSYAEDAPNWVLRNSEFCISSSTDSILHHCALSIDM